MKRAAFTALWLAGLLWTPGAGAQPGPVIEGAVEAWLDSGLAPDGERLPQRHGAPMVPVTLTLARQATPEMLQRLGSLAGVDLRWVEGRWLHRGRLVPALVSERGLRSLSRWAEIRRVTAGVGRGPVPPLDHTTSLVGVAAARQRWVGESALTGRGVTLADLDTLVDVFHPDFFAADGGAWDWLDVDGDGRLTPGVDAVDLDGDGEPGEGEVLQVLRALPLSFNSTVEELPVRPSYFDASWDWLYADTDGDGERDYGPNAGFDDDTPAFGEPLFVVDDIDLNGRLDRSERLLRLSSSRVRAVMLSYRTGAVRVFRRGEDLTDLPDAPFGQGAYGMPEAMHATGVLSIAAGGVPHLGRPMTGFAPEAELLVSYDGGWDAVAATMWALEEGADVVLHEYAPWALVTLDGSDPLSEVIDDSTDDDGALHVCPVGNTGGTRKHTMVALEPAEVAELVMEVPDWGFQYIAASLHWRPVPSSVSVALVGPTGARYELSSSPGGQEIEGSEGWVWVDTTPGGTGMVHLQLQGAPPEGSWLFEVSNDGDEAVTVHGFVQDGLSGWAEGVAWERSIATDVSNIGLPSTAERCLAVAASAGHEGSPERWWFRGEESEGEVRLYSGRGPRIDGLQKPDLTAPDNPLAAFPRWSEQEVGAGVYWVFGGTSGAGPHVAGAAVLLSQLGLSGGEVHERLLAGGQVDELTGEVPNTAYGWGRVDLYEALERAEGGEPPRLMLEVVEEGEVSSVVEVLAEVEDPEGEAIEIRWDVGYDGEWDGEFAAVSPQEVELPSDPGRLAIKAEARDEAGMVGRAVAWIDVVESGGGDGGVDAAPDADVEGAPDADVDGAPEGDAGVSRYDVAGGGCGCAHGGGRLGGGLLRVFSL